MDKNSDKEKLLTVEEVAAILRVSYRTVVRYIESGRLRASKIGVWRIKQSDLEYFLDRTSNTNKKEKR